MLFLSLFPRVFRALRCKLVPAPPIRPVAQGAKIALRPRNSVGGQSLNRDSESKANPNHLDNRWTKIGETGFKIILCTFD